MKKIAVLTHHWVSNFGANLQAYATYLNLKDRFDVEFLNFIPCELENRYKEIIPKIQYDEHISFMNEYLPLSEVLRNENEIVGYCNSKKFDVIISGSDAIFRLFKDGTNSEGVFPNPFWLTWTKQLDYLGFRTAFLAGSCTGSNYLSFPKELKRGIRDALENVDYISVRDKWTRLMFRVVGFRGQVHICPDPVSNLSQFNPFSITHHDKVKSIDKKYILYSARDNRFKKEWIKSFKQLCNENDMLLVSLPMPENSLNIECDIKLEHPIHPAEWYNLIKNANGVLGERFHLLVTSLVNDTPFVIVDHYRKYGIKQRLKFLSIPQSSKVYSIANEIKLNKNLIPIHRISFCSALDVFKLLKKNDREMSSSTITKMTNVFKKNLDNILN